MKDLKSQVYDSIEDLGSYIVNMEDLIDDLDNSTEVDYSSLYNCLKDIKSKLENVEDKFSDFENEVDDLHIEISNLLGKVGN